MFNESCQLYTFQVGAISVTKRVVTTTRLEQGFGIVFEHGMGQKWGQRRHHAPKTQCLNSMEGAILSKI